MLTYYIAGVPSCPDFGHAKFIAEKLKRSLPYFSYEVVVKTEENYQKWLENFCLEQKWKTYTNPLIWKRIKNSSGPCHLIGGINEFFVLLTEYYGIDTRLDEQMKKKIAKDNQMRMKFVLANQNNMPVRRVTPRKVCITGAVYSTTIHLVSELLQLKQLHTEDGVIICLHHRDTKKYADLIKIKNELSDAEFNTSGYRSIKVVNSLEEGLINCELLIVIGTIKRFNNEDQLHPWMNRHYKAMKSLASILNRHCPDKCKVMLMSMDLLCFNLNVLAEHANKCYLYNFVGVTGHYGMEMLPTISQTTGIPKSDLHCPPVWGYVGVKQYVDIDHTIYRRRDSVQVDADGATTIAFGRSANNTETHKYLLNMVLQSADLVKDTANDCDETNDSMQSDCLLKSLPEIRAALRLLSEWFENGNNATISAAIFSDGTFGLPFGMFMSQPVIIENGEWKPNYYFPSPGEKIILDIVSRVKEIAYEYNLGERFQMKRTVNVSDK